LGWLFIESSDTTEGTVSRKSLTFGDSNWDASQIVTVTGIDDLIADGNQAFRILLTINTAATTDSTGYANLDPADVQVVNTDDETAGFTVTPVGGNTSEDGTQTSFTIRLNSQPDGNVVIDLTSSDTTEGTINQGPMSVR